MATWTEAQARAILSRAVHVDRLLSQVRRMVEAHPDLATPFVMDLLPEQIPALLKQVDDIQALLEDALAQLDIPLPPPHQSVRRAASTTLTFAIDALEEWKPEALSAYGVVHPEAAQQVERLALALQQQLAVLQQHLFDEPQN